MSNTSHLPVEKFDGNYGGNFQKVWKAIENELAGTSIKNKAISNGNSISLHGVFILGLMSNCPNMGVNFENGWTMKEICDKNVPVQATLTIERFSIISKPICLTILKNVMLSLFLIRHP